jgi:hypothetical protein
VRHKRAAFRGRAAAADPGRFAFVDEAGAHTALARRHGRAPRGQRPVATAPAAPRRTATPVSAIRRDGVAAAPVLEGATGAAAFGAFVRGQPVPASRPGGVVVLGDLAAHKAGGVARAARAAGAGLGYLPPYSPGYNPVEQVRAEVKASLRRAEARATEALWQAVGEAPQAVTPQDRRNSYAHCGYPATLERNAL